MKLSEERISKPEDRSADATESEKQKGKKNEEK